MKSDLVIFLDDLTYVGSLQKQAKIHFELFNEHHKHILVIRNAQP